MAVGLLGLQTSTRRVAAVTSRAIASRSCRPAASTGTLIAVAPDWAASWEYMENDGQACTSSAPGSSSASAAASRISHEPLPTATRAGEMSQRWAIAWRSADFSGSG